MNIENEKCKSESIYCFAVNFCGHSYVIIIKSFAGIFFSRLATIKILANDFTIIT